VAERGVLAAGRGCGCGCEAARPAGMRVAGADHGVRAAGGRARSTARDRSDSTAAAEAWRRLLPSDAVAN